MLCAQVAVLLSASGSSALNRNQTDQSIGTRLAWWLRGSIRKLVLIISKPLAQSLKPVTIRTILTLVVSQGGDIRQLDMLNAFLNGELNEDVYMTHPTPLWIPNILHMFVSHRSLITASSKALGPGLLGSPLCFRTRALLVRRLTPPFSSTTRAPLLCMFLCMWMTY